MYSALGTGHWALGTGGESDLRDGPALAARCAGFSLRVRQAEPNIALSIDLTSSEHLHALVRHAWQSYAVLAHLKLATVLPELRVNQRPRVT